MLETLLFLALFSRRKVSVDDRIILTNKFFYIIEFIRFVKKNSLSMLSIGAVGFYFLPRRGFPLIKGILNLTIVGAKSRPIAPLFLV